MLIERTHSPKHHEWVTIWPCMLFAHKKMKKMNIYDTKQIYCTRCEKWIGEVDYEAKIINALCGQCANPLPEDDKILYTVSHYQSKSNKQVLNPELLIEI